MNTVDSIINLIRRYGMACYNQASPEHFDAEVKDALLLQIHTALQEFAAEKAGEPVGYVSEHNVEGPFKYQFHKEMSSVYPDNCKSITAVFAAPQPKCVCGENTLGVVHRDDGPCYWPTEPHIAVAAMQPEHEPEHEPQVSLQSAQPVAQPLTDEEIYAIVRNSFECVPLPYDIRLTRAIEKHHGIGAKE